MSLPDQICERCYVKLKSAMPFLKLAKQSAMMWHKVADYLLTLNAKRNPANIYVVVNGEEISTHLDHRQPPTEQADDSSEQVLKNLSRRLKKDIYYKKIRERRRKLKMSGFYQCPECQCKFMNLLNLNQHLKFMGKRQCEHCNQIIDSKETKKHYEQHGVSTVSCKICFETFESVNSLAKHKKANHSKGSGFCVDCKRTFKDDTRLTTHRAAMHADQVCVGCGKKFSSRMCYVKHMGICQKAVGKSSQFICDYCGKEYQFKNTLKVHIINAHLKGPQFHCDVCGKMVLSRFALEEHSNKHVPVSDRFICDICGSKYATRQGYRRHRKRHLDDGSLTSSKPVKFKLECELCPRKFARQDTFSIHMRAHKLKETAGQQSSETDEAYETLNNTRKYRLECKLCSKNFAREHTFKAHMEAHERKKSVREQPLVEPEEQDAPIVHATEPKEQVIEIIQLDEPVKKVDKPKPKIVFI